MSCFLNKVARHDKICKSKINIYFVHLPKEGKCAEANLLTHLRPEAVSDMASLDMISMRALVVSENLDMSTGAGTLGKTVRGPDVISSDTIQSFLSETIELLTGQPFHDEVEEVRHCGLRFC